MKKLKKFEDIKWIFDDEEYKLDENDNTVWAFNFYIPQDDGVKYGEFFLSKIVFKKNTLVVDIYKNLTESYKDKIHMDFKLSFNSVGGVIEDFIKGDEKVIYMPKTSNNYDNMDCYYFIKNGEEPPSTNEIRFKEDDIAFFIIKKLDLDKEFDNIYDSL